MFKMMRNKKGFTLVELMVVAVIVAILAAVAIPLMMGNKVRAMASEAEAALGHIRTAMRAHYAENDTYVIGGVAVVAAAPELAAGYVPGLRAQAAPAPGDLDGRFFSEECYEIILTTATGFTALCTWNDSVVSAAFTPKAADVVGTDNTTSIDHLGEIVRVGY
ncbi:unnamed protein product [marine sediment metagenome]|uniref:Type II secretion system protein GspG C-terminal domain-containing protein n=1 Tax=marine sediment metagenome TaxID=412755 RepID=X0VKL5_9ZZZZ